MNKWNQGDSLHFSESFYTHQIRLKLVWDAEYYPGGGPASSISDPYEREPYHSSHHAPIVSTFWQWRNADQIAVWSHCLHVSQPPSMIMSESCWAPEPGSGLSGPGWFRGWHFPSMTGLTELQPQPPLMCLSWAPQHSAGSWNVGAQVLPVPVSFTVPPGESQTIPACVCSDTTLIKSLMN